MVCYSGQYIYITGLFKFLFILQDLIDRMDSYFQRIAFQKNLVLLASNNQHHKFFPMKLSSLHWNGTAYNYKEKLGRKVTDEYQMS